MEKNNLNSFYEKIAQDKELKSRVKPIIEKMKDSKNLDEIFKNELIPVAKLYGFELTLKDFLTQEGESKKALSLDELEDVSGGIAAKPLMLTALTLFGLLGTGAAAMQAHAADIPDQSEAVYVSLSDSSDDETSDEYSETDNMYQENDNVAEAEHNENENSSVSENCVATINGQEYESLESAINAAKDGDTIRVEKDTTIEKEIKISQKSITIVSNGEKTIKRGGSNYNHIFVVDNGTLNIGDDNAKNHLIIDGGSFTDKNRGPEDKSNYKRRVYNPEFDAIMYVIDHFKGQVDSLIKANNSNLNIKNAEFCNNCTGYEAGTGAGAIDVHGGKTNISQTDICYNSGWDSAGAMSFKGAEVNVDNVKIYNNTSSGKAGAISIFRSTFNASGQFEAYNNGGKRADSGFMFADRESKISLNGQGTIYNNEGGNAGAFELNQKSVININGQFDIYNNKGGKGGAFAIDESELNMSKESKIHDNSGKEGNNIYNKGGTLNIDDYNQVQDNNAEENATIDLISYNTDKEGNNYRAQIRTVESNAAGGEEHEHEHENELQEIEDDDFKDFDLGPQNDEGQEECNVCLGELKQGDRVFECFSAKEGKHTTHISCLLQVNNHHTQRTVKCPVCRNEYHMHNNEDIPFKAYNDSKGIYNVPINNNDNDNNGLYNDNVILVLDD